MEETMYEVQLPENWTWAELKDLTENSKNDIVDGPFGSNLKSEEYIETGIPVFKIQNIKENRFVDKNINFVSPTKAEELSRHSFQKGDLIITKLGNPLGLCCKVPEKYPYGIIVADLIRFRPSSQRVVIQYLMYGINSAIVQNQFKAITKGTTRPRVNLTIVRGIKFPLPPLPEQRAIVSKIEQLFSELDNGIANLKLAQEQLKVYRQAVLKKAFEGELTRKWREQQTDLQDAGSLLEEIRKEKEKSAKIFGKKIKFLTESELAEFAKLPTGWSWVRLGDITYKVGDVDHKMPKDYPNGIPYVATKDLTDELKIDFSTSKTISREDYIALSEKIKPEIGDIIFPRYGTIGKNILVNFNKEFLVSYSCAIIKNIPKFMDVKYIYQYLFSPTIKNEIRKHTRETTQANVGIASIELFVFPLCSLPEQQAIVKEIETRLSVCDKIEQDIEVNLEKAEALRQSILKKAFEGKLLNERELAEVRRAEDWEPAEALLEKIKAERAGNVKKTLIP